MINVSVVLYHSDKQQVKRLLDIVAPSKQVAHIFLIDNSKKRDDEYERLHKNKTEYIFNGRNLGYGAAHNIGIRKTLKQQIGYHLVVNSDIEFERSILDEMAEFMRLNQNVGLLMPKVTYPNGEIQHLCKLLPTPLDLIGRRFLPPAMMRNRTEKFELRNTGYDKIMNVPYLSGCFMLLKTKALRETGLFDERFFMYPEDIDLTRRIHRKYLTIFYPRVSIIHNHKKASYHDRRLLRIHMVNMCRYFNKWGWIVDRERSKVNKATLSAGDMSDSLRIPEAKEHLPNA